MKHLLLLIALLFYALFAGASNFTTGSITYTHIQGAQYKVIVKQVRDCRAIPWNFSNGFYVYSGNLKASFTPVRTSIREISFNTKPACGSGNTTGNEGWEEHTFEAVIDLDTIGAAKFKPICKVYFAFDRCCKLGSTTNLNPANYYIEAMLDKCAAPGNSGPVYRDTRTKLLALNQTNLVNIQAEDTADGDMLVYALSPSMNYPNSYETYVNPYTPSLPFRPFCLNGNFSCTPVPFNAPARGFYADSMNGNQIFTPVNQGDLSVVHYRVKEYRTVQGVRTMIGYTTYEYLGMVKAGGRNLPQLSKNSAKLSYRAKANTPIQIDFATELKDTFPSDSVLLWVDNSIKGSSVQTKKTWRSSGTFNWTPTCGDVRKEPYFFVVNFYNEDDSFARQYQSYAYNIYVDPDLNLGNDTVICKGGTYTLRSNISGRFKWNGNAADSNSTYIARGPGKYFLELERNGCTISDTIVLTEVGSKPSPYLGPDTVICNQAFNSPITVFTQYQPYVKYSWSANPGYSVSTFTYTGTGKLIVYAENICGMASDTMNFVRLNKPDIGLTPTGILCHPFLTELKPTGQWNGARFKWNTGITDSSIFVSNAGTYWVEAENACGKDADTVVQLAQSKPAVELGNDTAVCFSQFPVLNAFFPDAVYTWSTGDTSAAIQCRDSGLYRVQVSNACGLAKDSIYIRNLNIPVAELGADMRLCYPVDTILRVYVPYAAYKWNTGAVVSAIRVDKPGTYSVELSNVCGTFTDSLRITERYAPVVVLGNDTSLKKPFSIVLKAVTDADWYLWNTSASDTFPSLVVNDYGTYRLRAGNTCGTDADSIRISDLSAIGQTAIQPVLVYPNPFVSAIQIVSETYALEWIECYDLKGQLIHSGLGFDRAAYSLDCTDWAKGMYMLRIRAAGKYYSHVMVK